MQKQAKHIAGRMIVALLALLMMNYSIAYNPGDEQAAQQTGTDNEIESVFELVTEEWMDIDDCVPEQDSDDAPEDFSKVKDLYTHDTPAIIYPARQGYHTQVYNLYNGEEHTPYTAKIPTPPPDMA